MCRLKMFFFRGFYEEMMEFVRSMFESALKTNDCLQFAVVTGCLRINVDAPSSLGSKEPRQVNEVGVYARLEKTLPSIYSQSIFTGLNNLDIYSILENKFSGYFGFTQPEVEDMLNFYGLGTHVQEVGDWYDGYLFGDTEVYNPWSVIKFMYDLYSDVDAFPHPYWIHTSSNGIIKELIAEVDRETKEQIERLLNGETLDIQVHEEVTYVDMHDSAEKYGGVADGRISED